MNVARFHPRCPTALWRRWETPSDARVTAPAMLLPIMLAEGGAGARVLRHIGLHITWLAADGRGKAKFPPWQDRDGNWHKRPARKIWGEAAGGAVPIPPRGGGLDDLAWLDAAGDLVVGEGVESTLSLLGEQQRWLSVRGGFATLSLNNLQGYPQLGRENEIPLYAPRFDQTRPVFSMAQPGAVLIGIDADMKGLRNRLVQDRPRGPVVRRDLSGAERSALCAGLSADVWRCAGADRVWVKRPPMGKDFNDMAMIEQEIAA
jgi:hypothetical protein